MSDVSDRARNSPEFKELRRALRHKWRRLATDKEFIWETARLKRHLTAAYTQNGSVIRNFFHPVFRPTTASIDRIGREIKRVKESAARTALQRYVRYALRFGATMRLAPKQPFFRTEAIAPDPASKFSVKIARGKIQPADPYRWDEQTPIRNFFGSDRVEVGPELENLIDEGKARYVEIDDKQRLSLFKQLVDFAYSPEKITFLRLNAEIPYVMCIIGEGLSVENIWAPAGRVVSELQRELHNRTQVGRPVQRRKLVAELNLLLRHKGTLKEMALILLQRRGIQNEMGKQLDSTLSHLSQMQKRLEFERF